MRPYLAALSVIMVAQATSAAYTPDKTITNSNRIPYIANPASMSVPNFGNKLYDDLPTMVQKQSLGEFFKSLIYSNERLSRRFTPAEKVSELISGSKEHNGIIAQVMDYTNFPLKPMASNIIGAQPGPISRVVIPKIKEIQESRSRNTLKKRAMFDFDNLLSDLPVLKMGPIAHSRERIAVSSSVPESVVDQASIILDSYPSEQIYVDEIFPEDNELFDGELWAERVISEEERELL
ncbi:hypothetical protein CLU79DRAFT_775143 [Phycomyces nitens]|nr:hypothetical protein CLU79DRAFT_775143 [Phycomyces nitens]